MPEPDACDPEELVAAIRAEADQMQAAGQGLAGILVIFHQALTSGGVSQQAADQLTIGYWSLLLAKGFTNA